MSFTMRTSDVSSLRGLMHAARDLVQEIRICFSEEGLQICEQACQDNLFMFAMFRADKFEFFEARGSGQVCFCPKFMYEILANRQQRDVLEWSYDESDRADLMRMRILQDGEDMLVWCVWVPLVQRAHEVFESPVTEVDYVLLFDAAQISNIISGFKEFEKDFKENWLMVSCSPEWVQFKMEHGCMASRMRWTLRTMRPDNALPGPVTAASLDEATEQAVRAASLRDSGASGASLRDSGASGASVPDLGGGAASLRDSGASAADAQDGGAASSDAKVLDSKVITHEYRLAYLQNLVKCFSISRGSVFMYVKRSFPLVFEVKVGTLGELRLALMFRSAESSDDEYDDDDADADSRGGLQPQSPGAFVDSSAPATAPQTPVAV